ncbi:hypothetical protein SUGI_1055430 [Cryptomeria japonica]|nr:hypothetical protein SUGI_1055430 [Cryptomeria japonica]
MHVVSDYARTIKLRPNGKNYCFSASSMTIKALNSLLRAPCPSSDHVQFEGYWIERGTSQASKASTEFCKQYVLTNIIKQHLKNLARAVFIHIYPILLQGPTSSSETSLLEYLATVTGHQFVRINNHENTDLQEYLGRYVTDSSGKLVLQEGILVEAARKGYWIVLDELNLAPLDVLEALNHLLDDNGELFVPELQITFNLIPILCYLQLRTPLEHMVVVKSSLMLFTIISWNSMWMIYQERNCA